MTEHLRAIHAIKVGRHAELQTPDSFIRIGAAAQTPIARLQQAFPSCDGTAPSHTLSAFTCGKRAVNRRCDRNAMNRKGTNMANEVTMQKQAGALLMEAAEELGGGSLGRMLKFQKGKYYVGDDEIAVNSGMIAHVTQLARGYVKFKGGELVDRRIGKVIEGFVVPQRNELDDTDQSKWERNERNEPRDPWVTQTYLPLEHPETGELLVFVTGSAGGRNAVGILVKAASINLHRGQPIIRLGVRSYKHKQYGRIENPEFPVVGWTGGAAMPVPVTSVHPAFDDQVPF